MKKLMIGLIVFLFVASPVLAQSVSFSDEELTRRGWTVHVMDDDIDATAELITELDSTYAQLPIESTVAVFSSYNNVAEDVKVTIVGIDNQGKRVSEGIDISGSTNQISSTIFRYIEQAFADSEPVGTISLSGTTGAAAKFITSIPIGKLESGMVQRFTGDKVSYITGWWANGSTTTGNVAFELRWYPDDDDCLSPTVAGYKVLDELFIDGAATSPYNPTPHVFAQPIELPKGGWMAIYGTGSAANCDGAITVQGFNLK